MRGSEGHGKKLRPRLGSLFLLSVASRGAGDDRVRCQQDWARTSVLSVFSCVCRPFLRSPFWKGRNVRAHTCFLRKLADGQVQLTELCQAQGLTWPVADSTSTLYLKTGLEEEESLA